MKVVIVGAKSRASKEDRESVNELIEKAHAHYPNCLIVSTSHSEGIGKYVREKCQEKTPHNEFKYQLCLVNIQLFVSNMPRKEVSALYQARNASLLEIGDVYYYLASDNRTGMMEELIEKAQKLGRPVHVMLPGDPIKLI